MSIQWTKASIQDFGGGMDQRSAENAVPETYVEDLQNCLSNSNGFLSKRSGYQGYYGWLPMRVTKIVHTGTSISFTFDEALNIEDVESTPIVAYGLLSSTQTGDFSTTAASQYYSSFTSGAITTLTYRS